ncbi:hypothetical protein PIB30_083449 [Stylosanthes scabra]|uniref:Uncharacterized protein n=1 Tax=Stylosanthes scabra TaxID=79078 RepID=A0ABU6XRB2_9FABA|nr:hypothetical protein [Stylosanthes scabra]
MHTKIKPLAKLKNTQSPDKRDVVLREEVHSQEKKVPHTKNTRKFMASQRMKRFFFCTDNLNLFFSIFCF